VTYVPATSGAATAESASLTTSIAITITISRYSNSSSSWAAYYIGEKTQNTMHFSCAATSACSRRSDDDFDDDEDDNKRKSTDRTCRLSKYHHATDPTSRSTYVFVFCCIADVLVIVIQWRSGSQRTDADLDSGFYPYTVPGTPGGRSLRPVTNRSRSFVKECTHSV